MTNKEGKNVTTEAERVAVYDKTGREIMVGDVLKVYHFTGARWRKRYYMYKQVHAQVTLGKLGNQYLFVAHLNMKADPLHSKDGGYHIALDGSVLEGVEIVQGLDWYHDRPRTILKGARYCLRLRT